MQFQCNKTKQHDKSDWHISDNAHQNAFETYIQYIQDEIVEKKEVPCRYQHIYGSLLQEQGLGMVIKSLTGSRKVIEILNHLVHYLSYNLVEEIETDLKHAANEKIS